MLTAGADDITGTSGDDTIRALTINADGGVATTLSAFDSIDGGAGQDTLNIFNDNTSNTSLPASASIENVEIINIFNDGGVFNTGTVGEVDASSFEGAEQVWQIGQAADVINLGASTAAGFRNTDQTMNVAAAIGAASATVALDAAAEGNDLNVTGDDLNSVTVAGSVDDSDNNETVDAINLDVTVGEDEQTLTVNTAVATTLTFDDAGSAADAKVTAIDASASTGDVAFAGDVDVASLQTGEGNDDVTLSTTFGAEVTTATVATGAGDDDIEIATTNAGSVTVEAGAGDDTVTVASLDDVSTKSTIDGGEGTDTLTTDGGTLVAGDYTLLNNVFTNFEELSFTKDSTFDASRLADYSAITLVAGGEVTEVADDQALTTAAALDVTAAGYEEDGEDTVYAGNLDVTANGTTTVTAQAESIELTAAATEAAATAATLAGDVQEATVNVNNYVDADDTAEFEQSSVTVTNAGTPAVIDDNGTPGDTSDDTIVTPATDGSLLSLSSLTLVGDGNATVTNADETDLVTVDASGLNSVDADGEAATGLTYTSSNTKAESITLGEGLDVLTFNTGASTVENTDSITGFNLATNDAGDFDAAASDDLDFAGNNAATALGEVDAASLDLALVDAAANGAANAGVIFDFGGDTYVFQDSDNNGSVNDGDALIQLVGGVDQDLLVDMFAV